MFARPSCEADFLPRHGLDDSALSELFGWSAEYNPELAEPPIDSRLSFTPADFCIGESGLWFFSRQWENGRDAPPSEYLDDRNLIHG